MRPLIAPPAEHALDAGGIPTFSVLIAAYQVADYIGEALDSVLAQTSPPHEIVVCDDGSTDGLEAALEPYLERIVLVSQENLGEGAAKNAAARQATGEYLAFLDADDTYLPERLEALGAAAAARPDLDILVTNADIALDGATLRHAYDASWAFEVDDQRRAILERCFILGHAAVRRRRFFDFGGFDDDMRIVADWDLWMRMILGGARAGLIPDSLARYRVREGSLSTDRTGILSGGIRCLERAAARDDLSPEERRVVDRSSREWRCKLALVEARRALAGREPGVRRRLLRIAVGRGYAIRTRLKAAAAACFPGRARRSLVARENTYWAGAAGVHVAREPVAEEL
jgi:glycosyltransferase involved in cell wall biosynthesis